MSKMRQASEVPRYDTASSSPDQISADHRRKLFAIGTARGFDIDDLRSLTPHGSIRRLSKDEAGELIASLEASERARLIAHRSAQGTATVKQLNFIRFLATTLAYDDAGLGRWLQRFGVPSLGEVCERELAAKIITGLLGVRRTIERRG